MYEKKNGETIQGAPYISVHWLLFFAVLRNPMRTSCQANDFIYLLYTMKSQLYILLTISVKIHLKLQYNKPIIYIVFVTPFVYLPQK